MRASRSTSIERAGRGAAEAGWSAAAFEKPAALFAG
jgi:hypothetical protein